MKVKTGLSLAALVIAPTLSAVNAEWVSLSESLADGAATLEYDSSGAVTRLVANVEGDEKLTITGETKMTFAAGAEIVVSNGTLRFETPLAGEGALSMRYVADSFVWDAVTSKRNDYLPTSETEAVVVATGVRLDDLTVYVGTAGVKGLGRYYGNGDCNVKPYFFERGEGTLACQMQHISDHYLKVIDLNLKQVGDKIVAWTPSCWYCEAFDPAHPCGTDIRTVNNRHSMPVSSVALARGGYGLDGLTLTPKGGDIVRVEVANGLALGGKLTVGAGLTLVADGPTALAADGVWNVPLQLNGTFRLADPYGVTIGGEVKFGLSGRYEGAVITSRTVDGFTLNAPKWPSADWVTFATNAVLSLVTNVTAKSGGGTWFDGGNATTLNKSWLENDGTLLTVQFNKVWDGSWLKGVVYQIRQNGPYLQHRILRSAYYDKDEDAGKVDLRNQGSNMGIYNGGANGQANGYGLQDIMIYSRQGPAPCNLRLTSTYTRSPRGVMRFEGLADSPMSVFCDGSADLPENLQIGAYAHFCWNGDGNNGNSYSTSFTVDENGTFDLNRGWGLAIGVAANLNGGVFRLFPTWSNATIGSVYLEKVNFTNGGHIEYCTPRCGYYSDVHITVSGAKSAYLDSGLGVVGNGEGTGSPFNRAVFLDVADVTGSDEPDLFVNGKIYYSNDSWKMAHVVKLGAGTLRHNGVFSANTYPLVISNGTWQVTQSNGIVANCGLELSGGALALDDSCALSLGALSVGAGTTNTVSLGNGSTISFSSLGAMEKAKVNFVMADDAAKKVRIGNGLVITSTQRRSLKINGRSVHQDDAGYLVEGPAGSLVIVR